MQFSRFKTTIGNLTISQFKMKRRLYIDHCNMAEALGSILSGKRKQPMERKSFKRVTSTGVPVVQCQWVNTP